MKIINNKEIEALNISASTCVDWVKSAFLIKDACQLPPKVSLHPQGTDFINTMPCILPPEYHTYGCKIVSRIKGQCPSLNSELIIYDTMTGKMIALLDADWITMMRTGAVASLAINTFKRTNANVYSFIGLGVIGHATLKCLIETNLNQHMTIRLMRYKDHAEKTIEQYRHYGNVSFQIANTINELVYNSDVVISCITDANGLLVDDVELFKKGCLVVPVHTRGFQNCDRTFDKIFADDTSHVQGFKYFSEFRQFGEIGNVLARRIPGRTTDEERILSYNIGIGVHDVYFANKILTEYIE